MIDLKHEVQKRGFTVAHIKTDSIKIPNATPEIIQFVMHYGERHGYTFEHEATYEKMCLVNDAVYIAKYASVEWTEKAYGYIPTKQKKKAGHWDATGKQFAVPYVFKKLFSKESIEFEDMCETMSVATSLYLDMNENLPENEHDYHFGWCVLPNQTWSRWWRAASRRKRQRGERQIFCSNWFQGFQMA